MWRKYMMALLVMGLCLGMLGGTQGKAMAQELRRPNLGKIPKVSPEKPDLHEMPLLQYQELGVDAISAAITPDIPVSSFSKTPLKCTSGDISGDCVVYITFNFGSAVPAGTEPTVAVAGGETVNNIFGTAGAFLGYCGFNPSRAAYTCSVHNVDGCTTLTDYTVTLGGEDFVAYPTTFSSADDEFGGANIPIDAMLGTSGKCWTRSFPPSDGVTEEITNGMFKMIFRGAGQGTSHFYKRFSGNLAFSVYIAKNDPPQDGAASRVILSLESATQPEAMQFVISEHDTWLIVHRDTTDSNNIHAYAKPAERSTRIWDAAGHRAPFYACMVKYDRWIRFFIATADPDATEPEPPDSYIWVPPGDLVCYDERGNCTDVMSQIHQVAVSSWGEFKAKIWVEEFSNTIYAPKIGYVRFKRPKNWSDCPRL